MAFYARRAAKMSSPGRFTRAGQYKMRFSSVLHALGSKNERLNRVSVIYRVNIRVWPCRLPFYARRSTFLFAGARISPFYRVNIKV